MLCISSLFVREFKLRDGASRVRKGTLGSLPSRLLTPNIPCCNIPSIHRELRVMGIELKSINDQNSVRLRTILLGNNGNN